MDACAHFWSCRFWPTISCNLIPEYARETVIRKEFECQRTLVLVHQDVPEEPPGIKCFQSTSRFTWPRICPSPDEHAFGLAPETPSLVDMIQTKHLITILNEINDDIVILEVPGFCIQSSRD